MRNVLIVDTETTGIDPKESALLEIGAILYSIEHHTSLISLSYLLPWQGENPAEKINRIPASATAEATEDHQSELMFQLLNAADMLIAHNAEFDRNFLSMKHSPYWLEKPWLCTKEDFLFERAARPGMSLRDLALDFGVGIGVAHRALVDCQLIAEIFNRMSKDELLREFELAQRPKAVYQGQQPIDKNQLARDAGFRWNPEKKVWTRRMAVEDAAKLPFKVKRVG